MKKNYKNIFVTLVILFIFFDLYSQCIGFSGSRSIEVSGTGGSASYNFTKNEDDCDDEGADYWVKNNNMPDWISSISLKFNNDKGEIKAVCLANNTEASRSYTFEVYGEDLLSPNINATLVLTVTQNIITYDYYNDFDGDGFGHGGHETRTYTHAQITGTGGNLKVRSNNDDCPTEFGVHLGCPNGGSVGGSNNTCGFTNVSPAIFIIPQNTFESVQVSGNISVNEDTCDEEGLDPAGYEKPDWITSVSFSIGGFTIICSPNLTSSQRTGSVKLYVKDIMNDDVVDDVTLSITQPAPSPQYIWYPDSDGDSFGDSDSEAKFSISKPFSEAVNNNYDRCPYEYSKDYNGCLDPYENINWTRNQVYDINGKLVGASKSYFDELGKGIQTQSYDLKKNKVWATETLYDEQGRPALQTMSAPIKESEAVFQYKSNFIKDADGNTFDENDLGNIHDNNSLTDDPSQLSAAVGTLGHYYSEANSDPNTNDQTGNHLKDVTKRPYSRTFYDELNPGKVLKTVGGNKIDTNGDGEPDSYPQGFSHTMPAAQELYYAFGKDNLSPANNSEIEELNVTTSNISNHFIVNPHIQKTVAIDVHGEEVVSFAYTNGPVLASARSGEGPKKQITSLIGAQGFVDIHLPKGCEGSLTYLNSSDNIYTVYNLRTGKQVSNNNLSAGVYRIKVNGNSEVFKNITYIENDGSIKPLWFIGWIKGVTYDINYYDYSLNYYNEAGNLTSTLPPIGFDNDAYDDYNLTGTVNHIKEGLKSHYEYNTLGQLLHTSSPDEGDAWFKYRSDGQIRFSQNSKQRTFSPREFSYTNYDSKARPIESGVYIENIGLDFDGLAMTSVDDLLDKTFTLNELINFDLTNKKEQHFTLYDIADTTGLAAAFNSSRISQYGRQSFVAGNVSKTFTQNPETSTSWYSYDIYGRVTWIVQKIEGLDGVKTIDYEYDDVTGAVTKVYYQKGMIDSDQFIHRYTYDEDDYSLTQVETSTDDTNFTIHANYEYYETGGLKRTVLAEGLQGIDYVYNLNGALKAINHPSLDPAKDPGGDSNDAFGMMIDYYKGDYSRTGVHMNTSNAGKDQYNGNIKAVRWNNKATDENIDSEKTYAYDYDRNNWLKSATFGNNTAGEVQGDIITITDQDIDDNVTASQAIIVENTSVINPGVILSIAGFAESATDDYQVSNITYDANGNIQSLKRNKNTVEGSNSMDNMEYHYDPNKPNQLNRVEDIVTEETDAEDIKTQNANNYEYNSIGQLEYNNAEGIAYIYNASGLVSEIKKDNTTLLKFFYNDRGQRVKKESYNPDTGSLDYTDVYVRDASGTPMAIYRDGSVQEHTVYGASRLGVFKRSDASTAYELTDHLGNVRAVIKKEDNSYTGTDYYPFGMPMPLRNSLSDYRYAYQGQEKDSETGKEAFELRLWDARIGRWLTTDPYGQFNSPYLGMGNNPINGVDPDGGLFGKFRAKAKQFFKGGDAFQNEATGDWYWTPGYGSSTTDANGNVNLAPADFTKATNFGLAGLGKVSYQQNALDVTTSLDIGIVNLNQDTAGITGMKIKALTIDLASYNVNFDGSKTKSSLNYVGKNGVVTGNVAKYAKETLRGDVKGAVKYKYKNGNVETYVEAGFGAPLIEVKTHIKKHGITLDFGLQEDFGTSFSLLGGGNKNPLLAVGATLNVKSQGRLIWKF